MSKPYTNIEESNKKIIREFLETTDSEELIWHRDKEDRLVKSIGNTDWLIQLDNELPKSLNEATFIPEGMFHRVIKGTGKLVVEIKKVFEDDPKTGTGKKPKGSSRRLYTDEDPKDTVGVKFSSRQDIVDTLNKKSFKAKSHARQSQIINLIHQRTRAAYNRAKDPKVKKRLKTALDYITDRKEASKKKTQRLNKKK